MADRHRPVAAPKPASTHPIADHPPPARTVRLGPAIRDELPLVVGIAAMTAFLLALCWLTLLVIAPVLAGVGDGGLALLIWCFGALFIALLVAVVTGCLALPLGVLGILILHCLPPGWVRAPIVHAVAVLAGAGCGALVGELLTGVLLPGSGAELLPALIGALSAGAGSVIAGRYRVERGAPSTTTIADQAPTAVLRCVEP